MSTRGSSRSFLTKSKADCASAVHGNLWLFFVSWKSGNSFSANWGRNRRMHERRPITLCSSLRFLGEGISRMALVFWGSTLMPTRRRIHPRNFPAVTPKAHFAGFMQKGFEYDSLHWCRLGWITWRQEVYYWVLCLYGSKLDLVEKQ